MKTNNKSIALSEIKAIRNVRMSNNGRNLVPSILDEGIQERPWVTPITVNGSDAIDYYEIIRGHRRIDAATIISVEYPEEFAKLFTNGTIKVQVVTDISADEKERLKMDFNRENLSNDYEVQLAVNLLFDAGCSEAEVANQLGSLLGSFSGERKKKIAELEAAMIEANVVERVELQRAISKEIAEAKRGKVQSRKKVYDCPYIVMDCLYLKVTGTMPEHFEEGAFLPVLTGGDISKLVSAHKADVKAFAEDQLSERPTKMSPGPNFAEKFESICVEKRNKTEEKSEAPVKSMSRNDIVKDLEKVESQAMADVIEYHAANKDKSADVVLRADRILAIVEFAKKEMNTEWVAIETAYEGMLKRRLALQAKKAQKEGEEL